MSQAGILSDLTSPGADVETLTGNSGGAVGPNGSFNINTLGTGSITIVGSPGTNTLTTQLTGLTNHNVLLGAGTATITNVAPSATSGVPLISQGAAADPAFGTAVVAGGGTGAVTFTAHSLLLGQGTSAITALGAATNGQLPIGSTGADPVLAALTAGTNISITNGAGSISIASSAAVLVVSYTNVNSSPYVVTATDYYLSVDTTSARTVQLPNAPTTNRVFVVKDRSGSAGTNNISVTTVGGVVTIDGVTTYTINSNYAALQLLFNGTSYEVY